MNAETKLDDYGAFFLRRPRYSISNWLNLDGDLNNCLNTLLSFFKNDFTFSNSIFIASPVLYREVQKLISQSGQTLAKVPLTKDEKRITLSLFKYLVRMSVRATPFATMSGISVGKISESNQFDAKGKDVITLITKSSQYRKKNQIGSKFILNPSIISYKGKIRFIDYEEVNNKDKFSLSTMNSSEDLLDMLKIFKNPHTITNAIIDIIDEFEVHEEYVEKLILDLIADNVLIAVDNIKIKGFEIIEKPFESVALEELNGKFAFTQFVNDKNSIARDDLERLKKNIIDLSVLGKYYHSNQEMKELAKSFYDRYGEKEISLTKFLDSDIGISFGNYNLNQRQPLIESFQIFERENSVTIAEANKLFELKLKLVKDANREGKRVVLLKEQDLEALKDTSSNLRSLPKSFCFFGGLFDNEDGLSFHLKTVAGPSALLLMARFGVSSNSDLKGLLKTICDNEKELFNEFDLAELTHFADGEHINLLIRDLNRDFEVRYFKSFSQSEQGKILDITDLFVYYKNGLLFLKSDKTNKMVFPVSTSAYNVSLTSLPVYYFLANYHRQFDDISIFWDWDIFKKEQFLPRVCYENIILSRAQWTLDISTCKDFLLFKDKIVNSLLDDVVIFGTGDNEMPFIINRDIDLEVLYSLVKGRNSVVLYENLETISKSEVDRNKVYTKEVVIPFANRNYFNRPIRPSDKRKLEIKKQQDWLYLKIYTGNNTIDYILNERLFLFIQNLLAKNVISIWFFIRYQDSGNHLRIRFKLVDRQKFQNLYFEIMERLKDLTDADIVYKIQIEHYKSEDFRYLNSFFVDFEKIFQIDSNIAVQTIALKLNENEKICLALRMITVLLDIIGTAMEDRLELAILQSTSFLKEFKISKKDEVKFNDLYRSFKGTLSEHKVDNLKLDVLIESYENQLSLLINTNINFKESLKFAMPDYIHMFINRLFNSNQRKSELIIYFFLQKIIKSAIKNNCNEREFLR